MIQKLGTNTNKLEYYSIVIRRESKMQHKKGKVKAKPGMVSDMYCASLDSVQGLKVYEHTYKPRSIF